MLVRRFSGIFPGAGGSLREILTVNKEKNPCFVLLMKKEGRWSAILVAAVIEGRSTCGGVSKSANIIRKYQVKCKSSVISYIYKA